MTIFLTLVNLLIPATMVFFALLWRKRPPGDINGLYGYRTARSMKSQEAWDRAHREISRLWLPCGVVSALGALLAAWLIPLPAEDFTLWIVGAELILLILPIFVVEHKLKKLFD